MKLSICISYYNTVEYLRSCLLSICENPPDCEYEILVVDDASALPCSEMLAKEFQGIRVLVNEHNLGFAATNNIGWAKAEGEFVLFLNTDTKVSPGALQELVTHLTKHPDVGVVGPMVLNADGSFQPQCRRGWLTPLSGLAYALCLDRIFPSSRLLAEYLMLYTTRDELVEARAVSGCCMMVRHDVLGFTGGFDENLVQYGEDLDLCYRIGRTGLKVIYNPTARIVHFGGQGGTNIRFFRSVYYFHRSLWMIFWRYAWNPLFPWYAWLVALLLAIRFLGVCTMLLWGKRRVGTRKGARKLLRETNPEAGEMNTD